MKYKLVAQEHIMGCAVACTASLIGKSYPQTLDLFIKKYANTRGYYLRDLAKALRKNKLNYKYSKISDKTKIHLKTIGSIVFLKHSKKFPYGHYLLKTPKGWMNPWINFPKLNPVEAGFQKRLPGKAQWILYRNL